ncbi:hypothetical protein GPALN_012100 [Globodera pallida]|nr:hypothetical protein GPALN_012100 [Globodera pallida]
MTDLSVEEFDLHPSFNDTVWPAQIGDRPWRNKATTWLIIFGCLIILGMIFALFNGNVQQLEFLEKLEKNVQETINSAFENKHRVIANEIEGIINAAINDKMEHHFSKLVQLLQNAAIIVAMATVLILTTVKLWGMFKIALRRNTLKMVEEPEQQAAPRAARAARAAPFVAQAAAVEPAGLVGEEAEGGAEGVALAAQAAVVEPVGLVGEEAEGGEAGVALAAQAAVVEPAGLVGEEAEGGAAVEAGPLGRKARNRTRAEKSAAKRAKKG